ncbi:MAG: DUF5652 family protein [Nanoarchaeota archaeon]
MDLTLPSLASLLGIAVFLLVVLIIWSLIWKGLALWKAARLNQPIWFVVLLLVNTLGLLEILYLFIFSREKSAKKSKKVNKK